MLAARLAVTVAALTGSIAGTGIAGSPAVRLDAPPRTFTMVASGDILTESAVLAAMAARAAPGTRFDLGALLAPIAPVVSSADLAICHVELPMNAPRQPPLNLGKSPDGGNRLVSPYETAAGIAATGYAGAEVVVLSLHLRMEMQYGPTPDDRAFAAESWPVAVCVDPDSRTVHAGLVELADPATPAWLRPVLLACVDRTRGLVPDVH